MSDFYERGMFMRPAMEEFDISVRKIKFIDEEHSRVVFDAVVLDWRPIKKEWQPTKRRITCVGYFYNLVENDHLHVSAEETENPIYGPQWQIYISERVEPGTETELIRFLTSVKGVGSSTARKLVDAFGLDVISKIMGDASCLNALGLPKQAKENLYSVIVDNQSYEQLLMFLQIHGLPPKYTTEIYRMYGSEAIDKICDNPYALYLDYVIDFQAAARLDESLGGNCLSKYRTEAGVLACLRDDAASNGNLFVDAAVLPSKVEQYFRRSLRSLQIRVPSEAELEDALYNLTTDRYIVIDSTLGEGRPIYLTGNYYAEKTIAERIYEISEAVKDVHADLSDIKCAIRQVEAETKFELAIEQRAAILTALSSPISILTGGPGTGKTQTLTMLVATAKKLWPSIDIRVSAPTGKAAMRAQELTNIKASTIHRAIGYPKRMLDKNEMLCNLLIVDEFSMCDAQLCSWLLKAVWEGARILIVGDHEQLPSVGPGLVLRDMIDSGMIPVTRLTQIFRQSGAGRIISNAHSIIKTPEGQEVPIEWSEHKGEDFYFVEARTQRQIQNKIVHCIHRLQDEGFSQDQIAVLTPIHGGLVGTEALNAVLQDDLNPPVIGGSGCTSYQLANGGELRVGDKVIQVKNNYDLSVFNGETGTVKKLDYSPAKAVLVDFGGRDVWFDSDQVDDLDLAYTITTHRSQGSEFQVVIIPICEALLYNIHKNLMYTAITRAKKRVVFVGTRTALALALKKGGAMERNSNLMLRLQTEFLAA